MNSVKSQGNSINLHPLIIKLLNAEKTMLKRDYGFDEAFNIFDGIDSKFNNLNEYKPRTSNKNNTKKPTILDYSKNIGERSVDIFATPSIISNINKAH